MPSSDAAVAKIFAAKGRPRAHPLIVHLAPDAVLDDWADRRPADRAPLAAAAWPGPLTIILRRGPRVSLAVDRRRRHRRPARAGAPAGAGSCCARSAAAIAAPSANRFGRGQPDDRGPRRGRSRRRRRLHPRRRRVRWSASSRRSSTCRAAAPRCCARAGCAREAIEAIIGPLAAADDAAPAAPGTLASHYAPRAEVIAVEPGRGPGGDRGRPRHRGGARAALGVRGVARPDRAIAHPLPDDLARDRA